MALVNSYMNVKRRTVKSIREVRSVKVFYEGNVILLFFSHFPVFVLISIYGLLRNGVTMRQ